MSQSYTLEHYHLAPRPAVIDHGLPISRPKKLWSRKVAADLIGFCEALAVIAGGLMPTAIFASAGVSPVSWGPIVQSALVAALLYRISLMSAGVNEQARGQDLSARPTHMLGSLLFAVIVAMSFGAPHLAHTNVLVAAILWTASSYSAAILVRTIASEIMAAKTAEGRFDERIAVYGAGHIARRVADHLGDRSLGLRFVGVYDSRETADRVNAEGLTVAGGLDDLVQACREGRVDRIIIALPQVAERRVRDIARKFEDLSVNLHIVTHLSSDYLGLGGATKHNVSQLGPVGLMDVMSKRHAGWAPVVKRTEDLIVASLATLFIAPVVPLIALAIKLDSPGPVLFRQRRRGRNQRVFEVLKFRTMSVMEDGAEVRQATAKDPRVTKVGAFLRRTSLDELPQIWNVLWGDMSLVGPRPHALVHDEKFGAALESYANRHQMKPGVTGQAQVCGFRGETTTAASVEARVAHDLDYIRNWSLWLDIKILFLTVGAVMKGTNAK